MTYKHIEGESDREREKRHAAEYLVYVEEMRADGKEPTNYMNWNASRKYEESLGGD